MALGMSVKLRIMKEDYGCEPEHWNRCWDVPFDDQLEPNAPPLWDELSNAYRTVIQRMEGTFDEAAARTRWNNFSYYRKREWFKEPIAFTWKPDGTQITRLNINSSSHNQYKITT